MSILLFDIGGTNMRMAVGSTADVPTDDIDPAVGNSELIQEIQKISTPENPTDAIEIIAEYVKQNLPDISSACGGMAGILEDGVVSPNLSTWEGFNFQEALSNVLAVPVYIINDAEAAAIGEATFGAGKEYGHVAYIGIGTGIGGSHLLHEKVIPHEHGYEPGRQIIDVETGETFEQLVSGSGLERRLGKPAKELPREAYDEMIPILAAGLFNIILEWSPEVLVLGGSLLNEGNGYSIDALKKELAGMSDFSLILCDIVHASLGDNNGLYGAFAVSRAE
jgi:mannose-6-phosphate isomerase